MATGRWQPRSGWPKSMGKQNATKQSEWLAFIETRNHVAWCKAWNFAGLSAWGLLHHLCRANDWAGFELVRPVVNPPRDSPDSIRSFEDLSWLQTTSPSTCARGFQEPLDAVICAPTLRRKTRLSLCQFDHVAICPACAVLGYHHCAHQLIGLRRCPWHREAMVTLCNCGAPHPGYRMLRTRNPFRCVRCRSWLLALPSFNSPDPAADQFGTSAFDPVMRWVEETERRVLGINGRSSGWLAGRCDMMGDLRGVVPMSAELDQCFEAPNLNLGVTHSPWDSDAVRVARAPKVLSNYPDWVPRVHQERWPVWKAIARYLRNSIRRRHGCCLRLEVHASRCDSAKEGLYALVDKRSCALAQAYMLWNMGVCSPLTRDSVPLLKLHDKPHLPVQTWARLVLVDFYHRLEQVNGIVSGALEADEHLWLAPMRLRTICAAIPLSGQRVDYSWRDYDLRDCSGTHRIIVQHWSGWNFEILSASTCGLRANRISIPPSLQSRYASQYWHRGIFPVVDYLRGHTGPLPRWRRSRVPLGWTEIDCQISLERWAAQLEENA